MTYDYLIVGAGFAGGVMAERLASQLDKKVLIVEKRIHIGGNAYDEYDEQGILVHRYGPHIFHTNSKKVFDYLSQFTEWRKYEHKVLASLNGNLYPIPINRITLNKLYNMNLRTEGEVDEYYKRVRESRNSIRNSEDVIVNKVGYDLFEKFFKHFTKKQWDLEAKELAATVCGRVPVRTNDDSRYFTDKFQFMPKEGYTKMFEKMLANKNIEIVIGTDYKDVINDIKFNKLIYTGPIDYYFDYEFGKLPYRSIRFEFVNKNIDYQQECAVYNYVDNTTDYTRVTEYKHLTDQQADVTSLSFEYSLADGDPYYPIPNKSNKNLFNKYQDLGNKSQNVIFVGRLAEYQYYNMDQVVALIIKQFKRLFEN